MALSCYTNWPENFAAGDGCPALFRQPEMFLFDEENGLCDTGITHMFDQSSGNVFGLPELPELPEFHDSAVFTRSPEFQDSGGFGYYSVPEFQVSGFGQERFCPVEVPAVPEIGDYGYQGGCCYGGGGGGWGGVPPWCGGGGGGGGKGGVGKRGLSAQSMAARVRRRRISEKTQELGKLIPGGHKMNTAEMFQAAFKYIKFLQAQIGVLKLMPSIPESEEVMGNGEVQALVTGTLMQEKLYTAEMCIGPKSLAMEQPSKK